MASYQVHVTTSGLVGIAAAGLAYHFGLSQHWPTLALAALASYLGGMIPDLDHDQAIPIAQLSAWLSTLAPTLVLLSLMPSSIPGAPLSLWLLIPAHYALHAALRMLPFLKPRTGWPANLRAALAGSLLAAALLALPPKLPVPYLHAWAFMVGLVIIIQSLFAIFRQFTVHRGIFHSVPVVCIYAVVVTLATHNHPLNQRLTIGAAALAGAMSHLILDEIWSVNWMGARLKKSAGTAFSFWKTKFPLESALAWTLLALLGATLAADLAHKTPDLLPGLRQEGPHPADAR